MNSSTMDPRDFLAERDRLAQTIIEKGLQYGSTPDRGQELVQSRKWLRRGAKLLHREEEYFNNVQDMKLREWYQAALDKILQQEASEQVEAIAGELWGNDGKSFSDVTYDTDVSESELCSQRNLREAETTGDCQIAPSQNWRI
jgi:hypothetical protein